MNDDWYRLGIQDVIDERHTLEWVLLAAEEMELLSEYVHGRIVGEQLLSGEGAIYDPTLYPA